MTLAAGITAEQKRAIGLDAVSNIPAATIKDDRLQVSSTYNAEAPTSSVIQDAILRVAKEAN